MHGESNDRGRDRECERRDDDKSVVLHALGHELAGIGFVLNSILRSLVGIENRLMALEAAANGGATKGELDIILKELKENSVKLAAAQAPPTP